MRTPFHILLNGLALTDLCTGLIAQPFFAAAYFTYFATQGTDCHKLKLALTMRTIGAGSALYFIACTILLLTLVSIERWLHMSRRSLVTSRGGQYFTVGLLLAMLACYLTTSFASFRVYRIIRQHQQQVQANEASQNYAQQAIHLAKYKKSVITMLLILASLSLCFIPFAISSGIIVSLDQITSEIFIADGAFSILIFLSSSLNPGLYLWRMKDIRHGVKQLLCRGN